MACTSKAMSSPRQQVRATDAACQAHHVPQSSPCSSFPFLLLRDCWRFVEYLHHFRDVADTVRLDGIGGTMILVRADLHREGLNFPAYPYR